MLSVRCKDEAELLCATLLRVRGVHACGAYADCVLVLGSVAACGLTLVVVIVYQRLTRVKKSRNPLQGVVILHKETMWVTLWG